MENFGLDRAYPGVFAPDEARLVASLQDISQDVPARHRLARTGSEAADALYLTAGLVSTYQIDLLGRRQLVGLQVPGDYVGLSALALGRLDHTIETISAASLCRFPCSGLDRLQAEAPRLLQKLWRISMIELSIQRYWVFRLGRLTGRARIANFFCEMLLRLYSRELCTPEQFHLPITQIELAEICGMTPVHANRMLAELRAEGICIFEQGRVQVRKFFDLFQTGQYSWRYLYLNPDLDKEIHQRLKGGRGAAGRIGLGFDRKA